MEFFEIASKLNLGSQDTIIFIEGANYVGFAANNPMAILNVNPQAATFNGTAELIVNNTPVLRTFEIMQEQINAQQNQIYQLRERLNNLSHQYNELHYLLNSR